VCLRIAFTKSGSTGEPVPILPPRPIAQQGDSFMRRIVIGFMSTVSALVLLFSYHTNLGSSSSATTDPTTGNDNTNGGSSGSSSSGTYTGDAVDTRWGIVQVQITAESGKITKSEAVRFPTENSRDQEINAYAVPELNSEVVNKQSGNIDAISGATVTSDGYIQSVQSAIDQANL
jgi:uncharacterized protein with FMN-binding domain